ncbi:hypothetical protein [Streptomyces sp. NPDC006324]|uniref:hypothetical protein n=1 Tax=Streptomyces sp. NPDC006324 TaxID=3156751 RepID=UPI0033A5C573
MGEALTTSTLIRKVGFSMARAARNILAITASAALSFLLVQGTGAQEERAFLAGTGQNKVINDLGWG